MFAAYTTTFTAYATTSTAYATPFTGDPNVKNCVRTTYALAMSNSHAAGMLFATFFVLFIAILLVIARKFSTMQKRLLPLVTSFGWQDPRPGWWNSIRGQWRGMSVRLQHMGRYKGVPERLQLTVKAASPARVIAKRRAGFMTKPITLFGPPIVEPMNVNCELFWIRSDELVFVERLFARAEVAPQFEQNLIARFDVIDLKGKELRILRAVDDGAVKQHFNRPLFRFTRDYDLIETIASEEWKLAVTIVETLGLRGYETA